MRRNLLIAMLAGGVALAASGTGSAALAPNTVGSAQIKNHSIQPVDLATNVLNGSRCKWGPKTGRHYVFARPFDAALNDGFFQEQLTCLVSDRFEPNNTQSGAANLAVAGTYASMYPAGNDDWYTTSRMAQTVIVCPTDDPYGGPRPTTIQVFKDSTPVTVTTQPGYLGCAGYDNGTVVSATWTVHIDGPPSIYSLSFG